MMHKIHFKSAIWLAVLILISTSPLFAQNFTPVDLNGLELWLKADSGVVLVGGAVSTWNDGGGVTNDAATQTTVANRPTFIASDARINNKPSLSFDGSNDVLNGPAITWGDSSFTMFIVTCGDVQAAGVNGGLFCVGGSTNFWTSRRTALTDQRLQINNAGTTALTPVNTLPTAGYNYKMLEIVKNRGANVLSTYINTVQTTLTNNSTNAISNLAYTIGRANASLAGRIAEIIIYTRSLTNTERQQVEAYLIDKYTRPVNLGADINEPYSLCPVTLNAGQGYTNYLWSDGSTADTLLVRTSGTYMVTATDIFGGVSYDTVIVSLPSVNISQTNDTTFCLGNTLTINTLPSGNYSYLWNSGTATSSITVGSSGSYYVKVTDTNNCFSYSDTVNITVDTFTNAVSLGPDKSLCAGNTISLISPPSNTWPQLQFNWQPNSITTATYTVSTTGSYTVSVQNSNSCIGRDTIFVTIAGNAPTVAFTGDTLCLGEQYIPTNISTTNDASPISNYLWRFGNGDTSILQSPTYTYNTAGSYLVSLTATTAVGCSNTASRTVKVNSLPIAAFSSPALGCVQNGIAFSDQSVASSGSTLTQWAWSFGNSATSSVASPTYIYNTAGNYVATLMVADNEGCTDTATANINIVASAPAAQAPSLTQPTNGSSLENALVNFSWGVSSNAASYTLVLANNALFSNPTLYHTSNTTFSVTLAANSTYYWKVYALNLCNDSVASTTFSFTIFSPSSFSNLALWLRGDAGVDTTSGGLVSKWNDVSGNALHATQSSTGSMPQYAAPIPLLNNKRALRFDGNNDVLNGAVIPNFGTGSWSIFIITEGDPTTSGSQGIFTAGGSGVFWLFRKTSEEAYAINDGATGNQKRVVNSLPNNGYPYKMLGVVKNKLVDSISMYINSAAILRETDNVTFTGAAYAIGRASATLQGSIAEVIVYNTALSPSQRGQVESYLYNKYAPPVNLGPDIVQSYSLCSVTVSAGNRFTHYKWSTGDTTAQITVNTAGIYSITTTDVFGRLSSDTVFIDLPFKGMNFTDTVICVGTSLVLQPTLTNAPYSLQWTNSSTAAAITVNTAGSYGVQIQDTFGCTITSPLVNIGVDSFALTSLLPTDTASCIGNVLTIDSNGYSIVNVNWSNNVTGPSIVIAAAGTYQATATDIYSCSVSDAIDVTIKGTAPNINFSYNNVCKGIETVFNDLSTTTMPDQINTWLWNFGDNNFDNGQNVLHLYDFAGNYQATLTVVTDSGCSATLTKTVSVYDLPSAVITQLAPVCAQNLSRISGASIAPVGANIASYQWQVGGNIVSVDTILKYAFPNQGLTPVTLVVSTNEGCNDTATRNIEIYAPFVADFEVANVCVGDSSYFFDVTPSYSIISRTWNFGDATSAVGTSNPVKKYAVAGTYNVTLTVTNAIGCRDTSVKTVIAASKPVANFTNLSACEDDFYKPLDASTSAQDPITAWRWNIGGFSYTTQAPQRYFANPGSYPVKLVVHTGTGCADSITKTAVIHPKPAANFSYTPLYGDAPLNVTFTNQSTSDSTYFWEFGDGGISTLKNPSYTYTQNGEYNIKLTVTSPFGCVASRTKPYSVIYTELDYAVNEANVKVIPMPDGSSLAEVSVIGSNVGTRIIDHISYYVTLGGVGVIAEDWEGVLLSGQGLLDTFSAKFVVPSGKGDSYICVTAMSVNNGQQELRTDNNNQCFGITEGIKLMGPLPNPAFNESKLGIILPKHGKVTIDISNMMGQYIIQGVELELPEGRSDYDLPVGQMTAGEYFIRILYNDEKVVRKFIISR